MTRREQILLGIMGVVGVGAVISLLLPTGGKLPVAAVSSTPATQVVQNVQTALAETTVSPNQLYVLDAAVRQASTNPFKPLPPGVQLGPKTASQTEAAAQALSYTGYMSIGNQVLAIVDGLEYRPGEVVGDTGYILKAITPSKIVLTATTDGSERELPYSGDDL